MKTTTQILVGRKIAESPEFAARALTFLVAETERARREGAEGAGLMRTQREEGRALAAAIAAGTLTETQRARVAWIAGLYTRQLRTLAGV